MFALLRSPWFAAFAGGAVATLVVLGGLVALVMPAALRFSRTLVEVQEQVLPLLYEVRPEVGRIDGNVETVTPQVGQLRGQIDGLHGSLDQLADPVERLEARMAQLQDAVEPIGSLPELHEELTAIGGSMRAIRTDFAALHAAVLEMTDVVGGLGSDFDRVVELLQKTAEHVENLDRKTGPPPPE